MAIFPSATELIPGTVLVTVNFACNRHAESDSRPIFELENIEINDEAVAAKYSSTYPFAILYINTV